MQNCEEIKNCIACGSENLVSVLNLNEQPLANSYKKSIGEPEPYFPLAINRCDSLSITCTIKSAPVDFIATINAHQWETPGTYILKHFEVE